MASFSSSAPHTGFTVGQKNSMRLTWMIEDVATRVLRFVLQRSSSDKKENESLLDYYNRRGVNAKGFYKKLFDVQKSKVGNDLNGMYFDISLIYKCLQTGAHGLAYHSDIKWKDKDDASIESLLTSIKNMRNSLAHLKPFLSTTELFEAAVNLKDKLLLILDFSQQHYGLSSSEIDQEKESVRSGIANYLYGDFDTKTLQEYKEQLFYDAHVEHIKTKGKYELLQSWDKLEEDQVNPVNHITPIKPLPADNVYIDLNMAEGKNNKKQPINFEDVLLDERESVDKTDSVIVVTAPAGYGKTTMTKKIASDFKKGQSGMKHLVEHDLLFKVDCRNWSASSLNELIKQMMPETSKDIKIDDLKSVILDLKIMTIFDGFDELNSSTAKLLKEVLELKKTYGFTMLILTRPEKLMPLKKELSSLGIRQKHIELLGLPSEKKFELAQNYYKELCKNQKDPPKYDNLEVYLKRTEHNLADIWRSPYNIFLASILFALRNGKISEFKTTPRLQREVHLLFLEKLMSRLRSNPAIQCLSEANLEAIVKNFIYVLGRESLIILRDDNIILSHSAYEELVKVCKHNNISVDEMSGAFIQRISSPLDSQVVYAFPQKGLRDYMAAVYIHMKLTTVNSYDYNAERFLKGIVSSGNDNNIPASVIESVRSYATKVMKEHTSTAMRRRGPNILHCVLNTLPGSSQKSSFIEKILAEVDISPKSDMTKYHNVFACLLGMFFLEKATVTDGQRLEVLRFLKRCDINTKEEWFRFLKDTECDTFVASYICQEFNLLEGEVLIEDHSLNAHIALLKALHTSPRDRAEITLDIKRDPAGLIEVLHLIHRHQLKLKSVVIKDNLREMTKAFQDPEFPLIDQEVSIDMNEPVSLYDICELLEAVQEKNCVIRNLQLKDDIIISDSNVDTYNRSLKALPELLEGAFKGYLKVNISKDCPSFQSLLAHINRNKFLVAELKLEGVFRKQTSLSQAEKEEIDTVMKRSSRCMREYMGPATDAVCSLIRQPSAIRRLLVSVDDAESLSELSASVAQQKHQLQNLDVCLYNEAVSDSVDNRIMPLNGSTSVDTFVNLILPELNEECLIKVLETARRLMPTQPSREFSDISFPRPLCGLSQITEGLFQQGLRVRWALKFPSGLRPKEAEKRKMEDEVKRRTGGEHGIYWGGRIRINATDPGIDIDSW